ncbi:MAG: SHOCT domain-containing protein [Caldiserica bacterium]|nr:SHOCT domain-containing protein [Caldisericota bacterium]
MMGFARYGGFERGGWGGMWGGGHLFMGLLCLVFFIALIVWIIRMATWRRHGMGCGMGGMRHMHGMYDDRDLMQNGQDEALDILRKRFASGDMTKEEYEERLKILNGEKLP